MTNWLKTHGATLALLLTSLGSFGAGVESWGEVLTPSFVFGVIAAVGAVLRAVYTPVPGGEKV